jgi:ribosomal protein S1
MSRSTESVDETGWARFAARYGVGDVVRGEVVSTVPFGAFVRVGEGVEGLAPKPAWPQLPGVGSRIEARIVAIDPDNRRFALHPA